MNMPWLRIYHESRNDAKIRSLSDKQHRIWFNLLLFASEQSSRGTIVYPDIELLALEISEPDTETICNTLKRLVTLRIVTWDSDAQTITFTHFLERQYDNPSDYPDAVRERVRKSREKAKTAEIESETPKSLFVADDVTTCNAQIREDHTRPEEIILDHTRPDQTRDAVTKSDKPVGSVGVVGENKFSGSGSVPASPGGPVFFEDCSEALLLEGLTGLEIRNAIAEAKQNPPKGPIRNPMALLRKIALRQREEKSTSSGAHAPPSLPKKPPMPPELKAWQQQYDSIPLAERLARFDAEMAHIPVPVPGGAIR